MNLQHCSVGTFGEVVDQIVYLLRRCQNLGASNRTPVRKQTQVEYTIDGGKEERGVCERQKKHASLVHRLISIGYYWLY
jgi:hypothetical protein